MWIVVFIVSCLILAVSNFCIKNYWWSNVLVSIACSSISASLIAFYVDLKSKKTLDKAKSACCEELVTDIKSLCSILFWLYEELNNNKSPILERKIDFNNNFEFRNMLVKCQEFHIDKEIGFDELCSIINKYSKLELSNEQVLFLRRISLKNISFLVEKISIDIQELKNVFLKLDPAEFLKFKEAVKKSEKLINNVAGILQFSQNKNLICHNVLSTLERPIKQIGKFLNLDKIHVSALLTLPEKLTDVIC